MQNKKFKINQFDGQITSSNHKYNNVLNRESFSHRICDDLCQVLLSYLSFEDKIKFESISKQWKRLIFNKQNSLEISDHSKRTKNTLNSLRLNIFTLNINAFKVVFKKCKFINQIIIDRELNHFNSECVLQFIIKSCNYLKEIKFCFNKLSNKTLRRFGHEFGKKLQIITIYDFTQNEENFSNSYKYLLRFCPNVIQVNKGLITHLSQLITSNEILVPKLTKVNIFYEMKDNKLIKTFSNYYKNTLKSVEFIIKDENIDENSAEVVMQQILHLKRLEELKLRLGLRKTNNSIVLFKRDLKAIAIQCNQIKRFEFTFLGIKDYDVFQLMSHLKQLKYLELRSYNNSNLDMNNQILCKSLKGCQHLTHLALVLFKSINDNFFEDIHLYLPKLKHLDIGVNEMTDKALHSLAKLNELKEMNIGSDNPFPYITDSGLCNVINNCPQINSIYFSKRVNITHKTIEQLIRIALNKPNTQYDHNLYSIGDEEIILDGIQFTTIHLEAFENLPKNLTIAINWM